MLVSGELVIGWVDEVDEGPDLSTTLEDAEYFSAWVVSSLPCKGIWKWWCYGHGTRHEFHMEGWRRIRSIAPGEMYGRGGQRWRAEVVRSRAKEGRERHQTKVRRQISLRPVESLHGVA